MRWASGEIEMDWSTLLATVGALGGLAGLTAVILVYPLFKQARLGAQKLELEVRVLEQRLREGGILLPGDPVALQIMAAVRRRSSNLPGGARTHLLVGADSEGRPEAASVVQLAGEWFSSAQTAALVRSSVESVLKELPEGLQFVLEEGQVEWTDESLQTAVDRLIELLAERDEIVAAMAPTLLSGVLAEARHREVDEQGVGAPDE